MQNSRGARLAVPYRRESREGQLVEGDCVGGRNRWGKGGRVDEDRGVGGCVWVLFSLLSFDGGK